MIHHFFLPHKKKNKHKKAHLLSLSALMVYIFLFGFLQTGFTVLRAYQPGVLGTTSAITKEEIINLTNSERQKYGLSKVTDNDQLDKAALQKVKNMFEENYWAHESPSGKTPWVWIQNEGYAYRYAGENLARGFYNSKDVVAAWMASKMGHRENLLSSKYQEIGVAVEDGVLNGEKVTLVVQLFGTQMGAAIEAGKVDNENAKTGTDEKIATIPNAEKPAQIQNVNSATTAIDPETSLLKKYITLNPYAITRTFSISLIVLLSILSFIDIYMLWSKRAYIKLHVRHIPHASMIAGLSLFLLILQSGSIL